MRTFRCELHVHTVLSPCAEVEMIPPLIVRETLERGINIIAITDHNSTRNIRAVQLAAAGTGLIVLPGMELQTREEVHLLCLFEADTDLSTWQEWVDDRLPNLPNRPDYFGEQFLVDETGEFQGREKRLLLVSANVSLDDAIHAVQARGGLAIPAHVDRKAFGLIAALGFLPADVHIDAVEISRNLPVEQAAEKYPQIRGMPLLQGGDAHRLDEMLGSNLFTMESGTLDEIRMALNGAEGRSAKIVAR